MYQEKVKNQIKPFLKSLGYRVVRVLLFRDGNLQVMAEKFSDGCMTLADCVRVDKLLMPFLHANGFEEHDSLEISSPGMNRPLVEEEDYARFCGKKVKMLLDGGKKIKGSIIALKDGSVCIRIQGEAVEADGNDQQHVDQWISLAEVRDAYLVF